VRAALASVLVVVVAASSSSTHAQSGRSWPEQSDRAMADCIVATMTEDAHAAIMSTLGNGRFNIRFGNRMRETCGGPRASANEVYPANALRATLADAFIRSRFAQAGPTDFSSVPPLWHVAAIQTQRVSGGHEQAREFAVRSSEAHRFLSRFGECIAREAPEAVRLLLLTPPASANEREAFQTLQPGLATCLNNGATMRLDLSMVRESLAYNYYRLAASAATARQGQQ
jgi:hypothetical protein